MHSCEICGKSLTNPRAKTCSVKCRTIKHRRTKRLNNSDLSRDELNTLQWFNRNLPSAGAALVQLLGDHGKGALLLAFQAMNEYAGFLENQTQQSAEVQRAS